TGSYTVIGTVNDPNHVGSATNTLVISPATATVTLTNLSQTYDGAAHPVTVNTTPTNLAAIVTYNGSTSAPTNIGSYTVIATVNDANYVGNATNTLVIGPSLAPTNLAVQTTGNQLQLSWPQDHLGWRLQIQTNDVAGGISTNWVTVPNSTNVITTNIVINPGNGSVFLRLIYP
ncbi:MAG TPA: MBG domain-containing protein, partial [Verrucomicrobiae bacterium]